MLICTRCDSRMIVTDYETIPGSAGRHPYPKCFKCGSRTIKEEEDMGAANTGKCSRCGIRDAVAGYLCEGCFLDSHGISVQEYRDNKRHRTETPAAVVARLNGEPETKVVKSETKVAKPETKQAKEEIQLKLGINVEFFEERVSLPLDISSDLFNKLAERAMADFRTPELEAAYLIHKGLENA